MLSRISFHVLIRQMVNTHTDTDLSAAVQNALQTLLPQIREEIREEFRTRSGSSNAGGNPPPVTIHTWLTTLPIPDLTPLVRKPFQLCFPRIAGEFGKRSVPGLGPSNAGGNPTPMADNRTMAQMLQAPIEGYADAIVVPLINANNFELKQTLINLVQSNQFTGRQDPHNHLRFSTRRGKNLA
nr:reverse transcriptase domain-containing protein [Tanacetum cinerariifolium]